MMFIPFPIVLMVAAVQFWPVTLAIVAACAVLFVVTRITWVRVTCFVVAAVVVLGAMAGLGLLMG